MTCHFLWVSQKTHPSPCHSHLPPNSLSCLWVCEKLILLSRYTLKSILLDLCGVFKVEVITTVVLDNVIEKHIKKLWHQNLNSPLKVVSGNKVPQKARMEVVFRIVYSVRRRSHSHYRNRACQQMYYYDYYCITAESHGVAEQTSALGQGSKLLNIVVTNPTIAFFFSFMFVCQVLPFVVHRVHFQQWNGYFTLKCYIL